MLLFNIHPKRQLLLDEMSKKFAPHSKKRKLLDVCRTRWILSIDGLERFMTMYKAIAEAMLIIRDNEDGCWDASAGDAYSYASVLTNFDFILTLVIVRMVLGFARSATSQLQGQNIDVIKGLQEISTIKHSLQIARNSIDIPHNGWFDEAVAITNSVDAIVYSLGFAKGRLTEVISLKMMYLSISKEI